LGSADHLRTELVVDAVEMVVWNRRPAHGVIDDADQGVQSTSLAFGQRRQVAGNAPSMGSRSDWYDNALNESSFATLERELLRREPFRTHADALTALLDDIEGLFNRHRRHSALGDHSPVAYEREPAGGRRVRLSVSRHQSRKAASFISSATLSTKTG
jgi:putative transposase